MGKNIIKIAVQKNGRLHEASISFLASIGFAFNRRGDYLCDPCVNAPMDIYYLRDDDIPRYVSEGFLDLGIVGWNMVCEANVPIRLLEKLDTAQCKLIIAAPPEITELEHLEGKKIATSYPRLLKEFLSKKGVTSEIVTISGSVEVSPELKIADAVCEIVQSGKP